MWDFLTHFRRFVLSTFSGAMIVGGSFCIADGISGLTVWIPFVKDLLNDDDWRIALVATIGLTAFSVGVVNSGLTCVWFQRLTKAKDDLLLLREVELLQQPQLLKEAIVALEMKRVLAEFVVPLLFLGLGFGLDRGQMPDSRCVPVVLAFGLAVVAVVALWSAWRMASFLEVTFKELLEGKRVAQVDVTKTDP